jgi:hypothetical protein
MNIGNPEEVRILQLAERVSSLVGNGSEIVFAERPETTPRCGVLTSPWLVSCWRGSLTSR